MDSSIRTGTPLRQRMIEDMRMRKLAHKTQAAYIRAVCKLAAFLRRSPDSASVEDLRRFQLHLVDQGSSPITLNATLTGLKFLFEVTLDRGELMAKMQPVRVPRTLPVVLSREEVARLIAAAPNLKSQTALSVAYGTGLRASEVIALKIGDIDSQRMTLRVEQGKGRKDRYAMLSPVLLERLRAWWRVGHAQGKILPSGWLFPGLNPLDPLTTRQLNRAIHAAATAAHIDKRVSMHTLRYPSTYCYTFPRTFYSQGITCCVRSVAGSWRPWRTALTCACTPGSERSSRRMIHGADSTTCDAGRVRSRISRRTTVWLTPSSFEACSMVTQSPVLS
jgi:integrase/recombinase XerD